MSNRSALETVAGAHELLHRYPHVELVLRTPEQLTELSDAEVHSLWADADAVLLLGVFDESVERLQALLREQPPPASATLLALSSDPRLTPFARLEGQAVFAGLPEVDFEALTHELAATEDPQASRESLIQRFPNQALWLQAQAYRDTRGTHNIAGLFAWVAARHDSSIEVPPPRPSLPVQVLREPRPPQRPSVAVLDYDTGDRAGDREVHAAICAAVAKLELDCVRVLARWGEASVEGLTALETLAEQDLLSAVVVLQDFVIGAGAGRADATAVLQRLDVPVLKAVRLPDRTRAQWSLSNDGVPGDKVHNRIAMPELQGQSQPHVVAVAGPAHIDDATGLRLVGVEPLQAEIDALAARIDRWRVLQHKPNADKRVAIIYYNHPPGRHNIGADNLDVPATLLGLLELLDEAGYNVGERPRDAEALLSELLAVGVNLPNDAQALQGLHERGTVVPGERYREWFSTLPSATQTSISGGPLVRLRATVRQAVEAGEIELARARVSAAMGDIRHLLEGVEHPYRDRGLRLLDELEQHYDDVLIGQGDAWDALGEYTEALVGLGIEGLVGWGPPPGDVMTWDGDVLIPGRTFGHVFMGPQPPRGWEVHEELLHANLSFPPHHQYLAWYRWIRDVFKADVLIHVGRHSTAEFLPGKRTGLGRDDDPMVVLGDLPNAYIYIVDGVGEGIQAKRRGHAVIVDHLTPALSTTPLYDQLLELRQLVESYEASQSRGNAGQTERAVQRIRALVAELDLEAELTASMAGELEVRGITFADVDDELLVHEVGHYLTHLQEEFMPLGLHVFGQPWTDEQVSTMLRSMFEDAPIDPEVEQRLRASARAEREALLAALDGRFIVPGKGNDPIRTPEVLPTGRNFHALGSEQTPTALAWDLAQRLAAQTLTEPGDAEESEAVVLWASDTVRDEGAMAGFALALMGVEPVWNSRGVVRGIRRMPQAESDLRRDVSLVTSGLFRDLYSSLIVWLDKAWLLALDASHRSIEREHPELVPALNAALRRLPAELWDPGDEPLSTNQIAAHWVRDTKAAHTGGLSLEAAGRNASLRVFGNAPGGYGAGLNRLAERSGAWDTRAELADAWSLRMGHAYGVGIDGMPAHAAFDTRLQHIERTHLGRASNLYGLLDNNDAFDYLGGLSLAVESARGHPPSNRIISHADPDHPRSAALELELLAELRGRELNPAWIKALMEHGYAGARTMGNEFVENLWGWQITNPEIVKPWVWDEVKRVYIDDSHQLGLDRFLDDGHNVHIKTNILAVLLVAAQKGFYQPSDATLADLARQFAERVLEHGLPGSGHTRPDHPIMGLVQAQLEGELATRFAEMLTQAQTPTPSASRQSRDARSASEVEVTSTEQQPYPTRLPLGWLALGVATLLGLGVAMGVRRG